jgi:hypothetical protein
MGRFAAAVITILLMGTSPLYAQDPLFVVTTTSADVHKAPSTGSAVIGKAPRGKSLVVVRELGSWVSVSWPDGDNGVGYLHVGWGTISRGTDAQAAAAKGTTRTALAGPVSPSDSSIAVQVVQAPNPTGAARPAPSLPSHVIGLGGRIGTRALGFAATGRAWTHGPLGVQVEFGQTTYTNTFTTAQVRSLQFAPSVIYSPSNVVTNAIWVRPYIGGGINIYRSTLRNTLVGADMVDSGLGSQLFGGGEFTWANLPQLAVSADLRQLWAPTPFTGFDAGGFGLSMSAHWYVR